MVAANGNGRPGCQTTEEMTVRDWRNNWDPTAFWRCEVQGQAATHMRCEEVHGTQLGFMSGRGCVPWDQWVWEPTSNPPSNGN